MNIKKIIQFIMFKTECQKFSLVDRFSEILTIFQNVRNAPDQSNDINQLSSILSKGV